MKKLSEIQKLKVQNAIDALNEVQAEFQAEVALDNPDDYIYWYVPVTYEADELNFSLNYGHSTNEPIAEFKIDVLLAFGH
jgi:hypothetical protein